jgi:glycosyltransferase involved in cell wall biosynthesis
MNLNQIILIIPSYRPPVTFPDLIQRLRFIGFTNILVVNDGSPDSFETIFLALESQEVKVIKSDLNKGKGHALQMAFRAIDTDRFTYAITCDDDGQHNPDDVLKLALHALKEKENFYLGVRNFSKNVPLKSLIGNLFMRFLFLVFTWKKVSDTQTGLRCFHTVLLKEFIQCQHSGFNYETVTLSHVISLKEKIIEVPIETIYFENNRMTRFNGLTDSVKVVFSLLIHSFKRKLS